MKQIGRRWALLLMLVSGVGYAYADKPPLSLDDYRRWEGLQTGAEFGYHWPIPEVSNDGKMFAYPVMEGLVVSATDGSYKKVFTKVNYTGWKFSSDSRYLVIPYAEGGIAIFDLQSKNQKDYPGVESFSFSSHEPILAFCDKEKKLTLLDLRTQAAKSFPSIVDYQFAPNGEMLLVQGESKSEVDPYTVSLSSLKNPTLMPIHKSKTKAKSFNFDKDSNRLIFIDKAGDADSALWIYRQGDQKAKALVDDRTQGMNKNGEISAVHYAVDPDLLVFTVSPPFRSKEQKNDPNKVKVDIWSYQDDYLVNTNRNLSASLWRPNYTYAYNLQTGKVIPLTQKNEEWRAEGTVGPVILVRTTLGQSLDMEAPWRDKARSNYYLVSIKDGSRKFLFKDISYRDAHGPKEISPAFTYFAYYDLVKRNYFTYNLKSGEIVNVTKSIPVPLYDDQHDYATPPPPMHWIVKWSSDDKSLYLFDRYDLWQVDAAGKKPPVNLTKGYGRKHHVVFDYESIYGGDILRLDEDGTVLLSAFNTDSKDNGFYRLKLGHEPEKLSMGPYIYTLGARGLHLDNDSYFSAPIKVSGGYVVRRMSPTESPNFFYTRDWKSFTRLSDYAPEDRVNWMTAEQLRWKTFDGMDCEGILYKPADFDPKKKYPVIFHYYETFSDSLNAYLRPGLSVGRMNIPYFVSHGYVVCVPNIHYKVGYTGESAYNCVASAAKHLVASRSWVDAKALGLQGHSFGGFETNFIATKAGKLFAAGCSSSGVSNWLSRFGSVSYRDKSMLQFGQSRLGATPWEKPEVFVRNSPLFFVDKVEMPLLIQVGQKDNNVPPSEGIAMFTCLRRLDKPAWLLAYDDGSHTLDSFGSKDGEDFTIKMKEFFDYFLKSKPMPDWMKGHAHLRQ